MAIDENLPDGPMGITLAATGATSYALTTATCYGVTFSIQTSGAYAGLLSLESGTLDYETSSKYIIVVTASGDTTVGTATVTLTLNDVNEAPVFFPPNDITVILDGTGREFVVYTLNTTDPDFTGPNKEVGGYTIAGGDKDRTFQVSPTGQISAAKTIWRETSSSYFLVIEASDSGSPKLTVTTTIAIAVVSPTSGVAYIAFSMAALMGIICFVFLN